MARRLKQEKIYSDEAIAKALLASHGLVTRAARKLGACHTTLRKRIISTPALAEAMKLAREPMVDDAEVGLRAAIRKRESWALAFVLRTLGRARGFGPDTHFDAPTEDSIRKFVADLAAAVNSDGRLSQENQTDETD